MSLYNIALRLGQRIGPLVLGAVYVLGFDRLFLVAGVLGHVGFGMLALSLHPRLSPQPHS
jgi:hypothetical protein